MAITRLREQLALALALAISVLAALGLQAQPAQAITYGEPAGERHPAVVLILMEVAGKPTYRCSGTLISPTVVLTAGHCTGEPGEFSGMRVFTESDVQNGDNNFPYRGPNSVEAATWHSHPLYDNDYFYRHDVGVVILKESVTLSPNQYGTLPGVNQLDSLKPSRHTMFTAVGYGLQYINPVMLEGEKVRMLAEPHLVQRNTPLTGSYSLLLSNNASSGGICYGDSGGPNYLGGTNVVAGVSSFGLFSGVCAGGGGVFRMDRPDVINFVQGFLR